MSKIYYKSAELYDLFCKHKDYFKASEVVKKIITAEIPEARTLLDVACGTGGHLEFLRNEFHVEGIDQSEEMLEIASRKCPEVIFQKADLTDFDLARQFDVVMCLFGSIGYSQTLNKLHAAIYCMARHLKSGGLLIIEPWLSLESYKIGKITFDYIDEPELKACRMYTSQLADSMSVLDIHYMVAGPDGVFNFEEKHFLGLFSQEEYLEAFRRAELEVIGKDDTLFGYGLFTARKLT